MNEKKKSMKTKKQIKHKLIKNIKVILIPFIDLYFGSTFPLRHGYFCL